MRCLPLVLALFLCGSIALPQKREFLKRDHSDFSSPCNPKTLADPATLTSVGGSAPVLLIPGIGGMSVALW